MTTGTATAARSRAVLLHHPDAALGGLDLVLTAEAVDRRPTVTSLDALADAPDEPAVLFVDAALAATADDLAEALDRLPEPIVVVATDAVAADAESSDRLVFTLPDRAAPEPRLRVLRNAFRLAATRLAAARAERELNRTRAELTQLHRIGMALMTERDPDELLVQILEQARRLTESDAGSLYLVESTDDGERRLRFALTQNDTLPDLPFNRFTLPLDRTSIAGYVATTGDPLVIDDAHHTPEDAPYTSNHSFDERFGYRTRSMLTVPMKDHRGALVGVLQLINRKSDPSARITDEAAAERWVLTYSDHQLRLVQALAGQAAVSIENTQLYRRIENIFESFVKAAVTAIDQRDPTTAGHSVRVATLTCDMAVALARHDRGPHAGRSFTREQMRELRYAALLHDFGKVSVREEVLVKAKKLPPHLYERVDARFDLIRRTLEAEYHRRRAERLLREGPDAAQAITEELDAEFRRRIQELDRFRAAVKTANEPTVLPEQSESILDDVAARTFRDVDGTERPYLHENELRLLKIPKGSLDERERREIESHVEQTYRFLLQLPWTDDLQGVAEIAYGHHEKLDGSGYPRGVRGDSIPVRTRIMTVADIFDALTAADRPYKSAVPVDHALDILRDEAKDGTLDSSLVRLLVDSGLYRKIVERDWREL